jgi:hypothetical protein
MFRSKRHNLPQPVNPFTAHVQMFERLEIELLAITAEAESIAQAILATPLYLPTLTTINW